MEGNCSDKHASAPTAWWCGGHPREPCLAAQEAYATTFQPWGVWFFGDGVISPSLQFRVGVEDLYKGTAATQHMAHHTCRPASWGLFAQNPSEGYPSPRYPYTTGRLQSVQFPTQPGRTKTIFISKVSAGSRGIRETEFTSYRLTPGRWHLLRPNLRGHEEKQSYAAFLHSQGKSWYLCGAWQTPVPSIWNRLSVCLKWAEANGYIMISSITYLLGQHRAGGSTLQSSPPSGCLSPGAVGQSTFTFYLPPPQAATGIVLHFCCSWMTFSSRDDGRTMAHCQIRCVDFHDQPHLQSLHQRAFNRDYLKKRYRSASAWCGIIHAMLGEFQP